ncbi:MAG: PEP-CTERM sorting domain-containing protein [Phycisphaeraceae bacterium]
MDKWHKTGSAYPRQAPKAGHALTWWGVQAVVASLMLGWAGPTVALAEQSQLGAGDIVFLQASGDSPETFAFSPLVHIKAGTLLWFANEPRVDAQPTGFASWRRSGANGTGSFGEGAYAWVAQTDISAGTVVSIGQAAHGLGLRSSGDTLLAFTGTIYDPAFIAAIGWDSNDPFVSNANSISLANSFLPASLTLGANALELSLPGDNAAYIGAITSGTAAELRAAINVSSWTINDASLISPPASLTVTDAASAPAASKVFGGYSFGVTGGPYTLNPSLAPTGLDFSAMSTANLTGTIVAAGDSGMNDLDMRINGGFSTAVTPDVAVNQAIQFSIDIAPGKQLDLTDVGFSIQAATSGAITKVDLYVSTDGFATSSQLGQTLTLSGTAWGVFDYDDASSTLYSGTLTFRIIGYGRTASSSTAAVELDEVWLGGIIIVPEPASLVLLAVGGLMLTSRRRR